MTPEQKAWFEYGGAWRLVQRAIAQLNFDTKAASKETGLDYMILRKWNKGNYFLKDYIRDAWRKRAVCRAWAHLERRECRTCRYHDEIRNFEICRDCTPGIHLENFCNWEPGTAADAAGENTDVNPHNSLMSAPAQVGGTVADGKEES